MRLRVFAAVCFAAMLSGTVQGQVASGSLPELTNRNLSRPAGEPGGLKVLAWAGFRSAVSYTFDDALASQLENYPKLHATGVRMTFFVTSGNVNNPGWAQIARDGNELGNHTAHHCHADGTGCAWGGYAGSLATEYDQCTEFLKKHYGVQVWTTASPYGDTGYDEVAKSRFLLNRGVWGGLIGAGDETDPFNLRVHGIAAGEKAEAMNAQVDGARTEGKWLIFLFHSLGGDGGYAPVDVQDVLKSIEHAQTPGDVWIDSMVNVGAYWLGQKAVSSATVKKQGEATELNWTLPAHFPSGKFVRVTVSGGTLSQNGKTLPWNPAGFYEVALDPGSLTITR